MAISDIKGIDISSWQKGLPASALNSVDFAILKLSEGTSWNDPQFDTFYNNATIPLGAYVYSRATTEADAIAEAKHALSLIKGRKLPLGIYIDVEEKSQMALRDSVLTAVVKAFCDTIKDAGYIAGAYGSAGNLWAKVGPLYLGSDVMIWVAQWSKSAPHFGDVWQYSDSTRLSGFNGNIDGDKVLSQRFADMITGSSTAPQPKPEPTPIPVDKSCIVNLKLPILRFNPAVKSTYVEIAQRMLISKNYACGAAGADGYFGNGTLQGVKNFEEENSLPQDGVIGPEFWTKLLSV